MGRVIVTDASGVAHRILSREQLANAYNIIRYTPASNADIEDSKSGLVSLGSYSFKAQGNADIGDIADKLIRENQRQRYQITVEDLADHPTLLDYAQAAQALNQASSNDKRLQAFNNAANLYIHVTNSPYVRENQLEDAGPEMK